MLVLTRRLGERLIIPTIRDGEIIVDFLENRGKQVRVGITAPDHIAIYREEIWEKIKKEGKDLYPQESMFTLIEVDSQELPRLKESINGNTATRKSGKKERNDKRAC